MRDYDKSEEAVQDRKTDTRRYSQRRSIVLSYEYFAKALNSVAKKYYDLKFALSKRSCTSVPLKLIVVI